MTELQIGLIGAGGFLVVAVFGYNKWQEYRHRKLVEKVLGKPQADVLFDAPEPVAEMPAAVEFVAHREEPLPELQPSEIPVLEEAALDPVVSPVASLSPGDRIEPVLRLDSEPDMSVAASVSVIEVPDEDVALEVAVTPTAAFDLPDASESYGPVVEEVAEPLHLMAPLVDYIAAIEVADPVEASALLKVSRDALAGIHKPVHWLGYNERSGEWDFITDGATAAYRRIRVGLQLADRRGPLGESDLVVFCSAMQDLAQTLLGLLQLPPRQPVLAAAAQLDEFCANVDIQIGINVVSQGQPFAGTKLRALAEAAGMVIDADGRFVRSDDNGQALYVLFNLDASSFSVESMRTMTTNGLTFLLDVPRVAHGDRVFNQMVEQARHFAEVLHGVLVDDNRHSLSEAALEPIRRQIGQYQSAMAVNHLPAGSAFTQRLFS